MEKKKNAVPCETGCPAAGNDPASRKGKIGGEALIEGIMMKSGRSYAVALRQEDKRIRVSKHAFTTVRDKNKLLRLPIVRGAVNMVESLILSYKVLGMSADAFGDGGEEPTKFEIWLNEKFGKSIVDIVMVLGMVLGLGLGFGLFFFLPMAVAKGLEALTHLSFGWFKNLVEGIIRIAIFVGYVWIVSFMNDIKRTFQYHGAEHKTIFCYEAGLPLTVENVAKQSRFHPRCGTSFIFVALIVSVIISSFVTWSNIGLRLVIKLLLLPVTIGVSFEFIMYAGKHENALTRILSAPGLWMQHLTTKEPDADQIECAIASVKTVLGEEYPDYETDEVAGETYRLVSKAEEARAYDAGISAQETAVSAEKEAAASDEKETAVSEGQA